TGGATDNQNMFLYAASNMGIPSLLTLLAILAALVWRSWGLYRRGTCDIDRIIGLGAVAIVARLLPPAAQPTSAKNKHAPRRR
ncbi:MAG: hypothetical protein B7X42_05670, partial [Thiomonas sp. 14-66-4]